MRQLDRRQFMAGVLAGAGALAVGRRGRAVEGRKPNIVLIVADDLGWGELGCQDGDIATPHIDTIAANGVRFTNGYVSCPVCSPTRAGMLTGRYQQRFGHEFNPGPSQSATPEFLLPTNETLMPERLKELGYVTGMVGKWHLGYQAPSIPTERGFDSFYGFLGGSNNYFAEERRKTNRDPIMRGTEAIDEPEYLTEAFAREAVAFVTEHKSEPFFLYLPFNAVHGPLQATEASTAKFSAIADRQRRTFAGMLTALDDAVGRVLSAVRDNGLEQDTLIIFISDNGGPTLRTSSRNANLRGYKGQVWEGGIRVPFMMQWPGQIPAGVTCDHPVIALDILPTVVSASENEVATDWRLDGVNLLPYVKGEKAGSPHESLFWRFGEQHAVRNGDWKLVVEINEDGPLLFNLAEDPGEQNNRSKDAPERVEELAALYAKWDAELSPPRWQRPQQANRNAIRARQREQAPAEIRER